MKSLIINKPHLQSRPQKIGSYCIAALSWLLWLYFLLPLFTLTGWLMGVKSWSEEVRWFGGYKSLLELLQMYGSFIAVIALLWLCWTFCSSWRKTVVSGTQQTSLDDQKLCRHFQITPSQLQQARQVKVVTVSFDDTGRITDITSRQ